MIKSIGQHVKIFLRNSMVLEGIVEDWTDQSVILKSLDEESQFIIHHPTQDILLTKVILSAPPDEETQLEPTPTAPNFPQEIEEVSVEEEIDLRTKNLVELKQLKAQQERKILVEKMKDHHIGQVSQKVAYEQPGFRTKPRT
jgi:sRNA-binding regulator protein Hfq